MTYVWNGGMYDLNAWNIENYSIFHIQKFYLKETV